MLSEKFIDAVKLFPERKYRLAQKAQVDASLLSKWINGITPAKRHDARVLRVAKILGLKQNEIFEEEDSKCNCSKNI